LKSERGDKEGNVLMFVNERISVLCEFNDDEEFNEQTPNERGSLNRSDVCVCVRREEESDFIAFSFVVI
jgi:hypothetical protein